MSGLVVELCGLPGAGKTTAAQALVRRLQEAGVRSEIVDGRVSAAVPVRRRVPRKLAMVSRAVAVSPVNAAREARFLASGQCSRRDAVAVPVQWYSTKQLVSAARHHAGVALLEEGLVQTLWTAGLRSHRCAVPPLVALAEAAARSDLVIHIDVPAELSLERLRLRSSRHSRVQRMGEGDQLAALRHGDVLLRTLLREWRRRGFGTVLTLDGTAPVTEPLLHHVLAGLGADR